MVIFGIVVAWSIYISGKKAFALRREENEKATAAGAADDDSFVSTDSMGMDAPVANSMNADTEVTKPKTEELKKPLLRKKSIHVDYDGNFGSVHNRFEADAVIEENDCEELRRVKSDENRHVTPRRMLFYFVNFCFLFAA